MSSSSPSRTAAPAPPARGAAGTVAGELRAGFADDLFARRHRGVGVPVVNQFVWHLDEVPDAAALDAHAAALARGALGRRLVRSGVPGARDRWVTDTTVPPVAHHPPLPAARRRAWVEDCAALDHDPAAGPGWRLAVAPLREGGALVSLTVSHAVADGGAMLDAAGRAGSGAPPLGLPVVPPGGRLPTAARDLADAGGRVAEVARWVGGAVRRERPAPAPPPAPPPAAVGDDVPGGRSAPWSTAWTVPWTVAELPTGDVREVARTHGGTQNSWFVAVAAGLVRRTGRFAGTDARVPVALPVSTRGEDDPRGNATRIARAHLAVDDLQRRDLAVVRAACRAAYTALPAAREPVPLALVQMLPDAAVRRLPAPPAAAVLASNLGTVPSAAASVAGVPARSMLALAHQPGLGAADAAATGGGLLVWGTEVGATTTLSVVALDPARVPARPSLDVLVVEELATWGLTGRLW